ncbi:MAG: hypothetical protein AAFR05_10340 [Bacteroidota bacterium]
MKKLIALLPLLGTVLFLNAQVNTKSMVMSQGNHPALAVFIKSTDTKTVEEAWNKFIKKYKGKTKELKKNSEFFTDDAEIKDMSSNTVDVYAKVLKKEDGSELLVWFDLGGAYLSAATHPDRYPVAMTMLENFRLSISRTAMEEEIKVQEAALKKLNGELSGLEKEESGAEADIVKYEKKIEEAKQKIAEVQADQKTKEVEIESQQRLIKDLKGKLNALK